MCAADSVFESTFAACFDCISAESESKGNSTYSFIISFLDQFYAGGIDFCRAVTPESIIVSSTSNIPLLFARTKGNDHQPMATRAVDFTTTLASDTVNVQSFSIPATTTLSTTTKTSAGSTASTTSYQYGFWLVYTFILCPTRTNSGPVTPQANGLDALWGCAPGYVCTPPQVNCDLEAGPPPFDFLCDAKDCLIAPTPPPAPSNVVVNGTSTIFSPLPLPTGLFNLDPAIFGADWGIFTGDVSVTSTLGSPTPSSNVTTTTSCKFHSHFSKRHLTTITTTSSPRIPKLTKTQSNTNPSTNHASLKSLDSRSRNRRHSWHSILQSRHFLFPAPTAEE